MRQVRTRVWDEHGWSDPGRRVLLDIDAMLTRVHSKKEDAKGNYKRGSGSTRPRVSLTAQAKLSMLSTGPARQARTPSPIWLTSSAPGSTRTANLSPGPIAPELTQLTRSWFVPTRPGTPSGSCGTWRTVSYGSVTPDVRTTS